MKDKLVGDARQEEVILKANEDIKESDRETVEVKVGLQPGACGYSSKSIWRPVETESSYKGQELCRDYGCLM